MYPLVISKQDLLVDQCGPPKSKLFCFYTVTLESDTKGPKYHFYFSQKRRDRCSCPKKLLSEKTDVLVPLPGVAAAPGHRGMRQMTSKWPRKAGRVAATEGVHMEGAGAHPTW